MRGRHRLGSYLLAVAGATTLLADAPLRPPHRYTTCSPSGAACATSDPEAGTFGHPRDRPDAEPGWRIPRWFRVLYVADDGAHAVTGHDGLLAPVDDPAATVVVVFWKDGERVASHTLANLGYTRRDLRRTVSHYFWGDYQGWDEEGRFRLAMVDGATLVFDVAAGELLRRER